jgi:hypothetical protein
MPSVEEAVRSQFAREFSSSDWRLFKRMAETYFREAVFLMTSRLRAPAKLRLLVRNSRKRLYIGVGTELLLKAVYLKAGYCINKPRDRRARVRFPFTRRQASGVPLNPAETYQLDQLITQLKNITNLPKPDVVLRGLKIAKVFRNKEGHVVTRAHKYDRSSYRAIEVALTELYLRAFQEKLVVRFSVGHKERGAWRVAP